MLEDQQEKEPIYLYDLPKHIVTSVKIAEIIRNSCKYELKEPVQFKKPRISITGHFSPLINGIITVEKKDYQTVAKAIKYFEISDDKKKIWQCRALPFKTSRLYDVTSIMNNEQNVFLRCIPKWWTSMNLEEIFSRVGPVKSAKVLLTPVLKIEKNPQGTNLTLVDETQPCTSRG